MNKLTSLIAGLLLTASVCMAQEKGDEPKTVKIDDNFYCKANPTFTISGQKTNHGKNP